MGRMFSLCLSLALCFALGCSKESSAEDKPSPAQPSPASTPAASAQQIAPRWYKGNLHSHTLWTDGDDFPEHIALWYRDNGYDFLCISDHNTIQGGERWVKYRDLYRKGAGPAADRFLAAYPDRAKVWGSRADGTQQIRLSPLEEYRGMVERPGKFLLIPGEEITEFLGIDGELKPVHLVAINLAEVVQPRGGESVVEVIRNNFKAVAEQGERLKRPVLALVNHPNFKWGVSAQELAEVVEERFFEVFNASPDVGHEGDGDHPSVERMWDIANTLRLTVLKAQPLMGLGSDDSHNYHHEGMSRSNPGRGWICVRAKALEAGAIIEAMDRGDFYVSSGVVLNDVTFDAAARTLTVEIAPDGDAKFVTQFIGTMKGVDIAKEPGRVGELLAKVEGNRAVYRLTGKELYVRSMVISNRPPKKPVLKGQVEQAWTQPVGWEGATKQGGLK